MIHPMSISSLKQHVKRDWGSKPNLAWDIAVEMTRRFCTEARVPAPLADALIDAAQRIDTMQDIAPLINAATAVARSSQAV